MMNKLLDGFEGKLNTPKWAKITKVSTDTALRGIIKKTPYFYEVYVPGAGIEPARP